MAPKGGGKSIPRVKVNRSLTPQRSAELLETLKIRFENHMERHPDLDWSEIQTRLEADQDKLSALYAMESSGGEPDVVGFDRETSEFIFFDCSEQSPAERRSICYDSAGEQERIKKELTPGGNAVDLAHAMGIELLDEEQYFQLQELGDFDTKTESWLKTPDDVRELGGAIFGDRRFKRVFVFHNTAKSFYSGRGFRGALRV